MISLQRLCNGSCLAPCVALLQHDRHDAVTTRHRAVRLLNRIDELTCACSPTRTDELGVGRWHSVHTCILCELFYGNQDLPPGANLLRSPPSPYHVRVLEETYAYEESDAYEHHMLHSTYEHHTFTVAPVFVCKTYIMHCCNSRGRQFHHGFCKQIDATGDHSCTQQVRIRVRSLLLAPFLLLHCLPSII